MAHPLRQLGMLAALWYATAVHHNIDAWVHAFAMCAWLFVQRFDEWACVCVFYPGAQTDLARVKHTLQFFREPPKRPKQIEPDYEEDGLDYEERQLASMQPNKTWVRMLVPYGKTSHNEEGIFQEYSNHAHPRVRVAWQPTNGTAAFVYWVHFRDFKVLEDRPNRTHSDCSRSQGSCTGPVLRVNVVCCAWALSTPPFTYCQNPHRSLVHIAGDVIH